MGQRGTFELDVESNGTVISSPANLERLRRLFRDDAIIDGLWGPGDPGDFDNGSWHILCHLAGGAGVYSTAKGFAWAAITHDPAKDRYLATLSFRDNAIVSAPLGDATAKNLIAGGKLLGFVEGSSLGHVMARGARDDEKIFNLWKRQDFDQDVSSETDGGTVWEHWCTTRDIRSASEMGTSVLGAYLGLISVLGGRFVAAVARGRREHDHPSQLCALVKAGLLTREEATWDTQPRPIPLAAQRMLYEATVQSWLEAAPLLPFDANQAPSYLMFERRIDRWSTASNVVADLAANA